MRNITHIHIWTQVYLHQIEPTFDRPVSIMDKQVNKDNRLK
jgi:hypothetical protein